MKKLFLRIWKEQTAQDLVEYALILLLIALAAVTSIRTLSDGVKKAYSTTRSDVTAGGGGGDRGDRGDE
jgi:Flp pilus assembly pilin Flp